MPLYDYHCKKCNIDFELYQSIKSDSIANCPRCKSKSERKISMPAGIVFKGSGFYITDYKNNGSKQAISTTDSKKSDSTTDSKNSTPADTNKKPSSETSTEKKSEEKIKNTADPK